MDSENTVSIKLLSDKALERLKELEFLGFIKVIKVSTFLDEQKTTDIMSDVLYKNPIHNLDSTIIETKSEWKTRLEDLEITNL